MTPRPVVVTIAVLGLLALSRVVPVGRGTRATSRPPWPGTIARGSRIGGRPPRPSLAVPSPAATPFELRLSAGPVNPQGSYSAEPAPMGVADFGIDGQGQPYSYSTSTFVGTTNITSLKANDMGNPSAGNVAFELNTVLTFQVGSKNYVYWLQDGFDVESHSEHVALLQDYVWNFSTSSASLNASSVAGNGSFVNYGGYDVYITYPSKTLPGYNVTLGFPMVLELRIVSGTAGVQGVPWVGYDYNDGFGWVRGANVSFPFAVGALGVGQTVNGSTYTPHGAYYDAEFDYAGPGGGVGIDVGSHMQITLDRWTGHNLAPVPNAYNHGGNTGEKIENLTVVSSGALGAPGSSGQPGSRDAGIALFFEPDRPAARDGSVGLGGNRRERRPRRLHRGRGGPDPGAGVLRAHPLPGKHDRRPLGGPTGRREQWHGRARREPPRTGHRRGPWTPERDRVVDLVERHPLQRYFALDPGEFPERYLPADHECDPGFRAQGHGALGRGQGADHRDTRLDDVQLHRDVRRRRTARAVPHGG